MRTRTGSALRRLVATILPESVPSVEASDARMTCSVRTTKKTSKTPDCRVAREGSLLSRGGSDAAGVSSGKRTLTGQSAGSPPGSQRRLVVFAQPHMLTRPSDNG